MGKSLHPDVRKFKMFVKKNPYILKPVKAGDKTLQDLFEEYLLFGEEDDIWETYREDDDLNEDDDDVEAEEEDTSTDEKKDKKSKSKESTGTQDILNMLKKVNFNDLQEHLAQFGGVLASVQELLSQFKQPSQQPPQNNQQQNSPFSFHDD